MAIPPRWTRRLPYSSGRRNPGHGRRHPQMGGRKLAPGRPFPGPGSSRPQLGRRQHDFAKRLANPCALMPTRLAILGVVAVALLTACGGDESPPSPTQETSPSPAPSFVIGSPNPDIPIDHVIVLMQENRSFDHYFGQLRN